MANCAEISTELLKAYLFLSGTISYLPVDDLATYYIQHYGLRHVKESLGTFYFVTGVIETRFPDSQIVDKLKQLGLAPNANSNYIGILSASGPSNNPKYQSTTLTFDEGKELAFDHDVMGNKALLRPNSQR